MVVRLILKSPSVALKLLNVFILGAMTFRAIVTFSRGGILAAAIVTIAFLATISLRLNMRRVIPLLASLVLLGGVLTVTWSISSTKPEA